MSFVLTIYEIYVDLNLSPQIVNRQIVPWAVVAFAIATGCHWLIYAVPIDRGYVQTLGGIYITAGAGLVYFGLSWWLNQGQKSGRKAPVRLVGFEYGGILLLGSLVIYGPIITLYLGASYLAVAPLFLDERNSISLHRFFVALAFSLLSSGLLYVLAKIAHLPGDIAVASVLVSLSVYNVIRHKDSLLPNLLPVRPMRSSIILLLFLAFCGSVLFGSITMGIGDYPSVFFNGDTPLRLTHAYELSRASEYPPEALTAKDIYRSYHYGGAAAVAVVSSLTGITIPKAMFFVVMPIVLIGSFSGVYWLSRIFFEGNIKQYVAITVIIPFVNYGDEIYTYFFLNTESFGIDGSIQKLLSEFHWMREFHPEDFSKGVWDISPNSGIFILIVATIFMVRSSNVQFLTIAPLLVVLVYFCKVTVMPAVAVLTGVGLLYRCKQLGLAKVLTYAVVVGIIGLVLLSRLGIFDVVGSSTSIKPISQIDIPPHHLAGVGLAAILGTFFYVIRADKKTIDEVEHSVSVVGGLASILTCFALLTLIDGQDINQIFLANWIVIPLIVVVLMTVEAGTTGKKVIRLLLLTPIFVIAIIAQWHKIQQVYVTIFDPVRGHDYVENDELAEALQVIPIQNSIVATNDLRSTLINKYYKPAITGIFGHQAYAVDNYWLIHDRKLQSVADQRIQHQIDALSLFDIFQERTWTDKVAIAKAAGWTHYLLRKDQILFLDAHSPYVPFGGEAYREQHADRLRDKLLESKMEYSIAAGLTPKSDVHIDQMSCDSNKAEPDGIDDNVFLVDLQIPERLLFVEPAISAIHLDRKGIGRGGSGPGVDYDTTGRYPGLGIIYNLSEPLINSNGFQVTIPLRDTSTRFWLLTCSDGNDLPDSQYAVYLTITYALNNSINDSVTHLLFKKVFENNSYAVFDLSDG